MPPSSEPVGIAFDGKNPEAQAQAQAYAARMVTNVSDETRDGLRVLVERSISEGIPPAQAARLIRNMVGLTAPHASAVMNYRYELYRQNLLTPDRIDREVRKYADKLIRHRSLNIARTEVMGALNRGRYEAWQQAVNDGTLGANADKRWSATPDEKTCEICDELHGETVPLGGAFTGGLLMPPAHPSCRCSAVLVPRPVEHDAPATVEDGPDAPATVDELAEQAEELLAEADELLEETEAELLEPITTDLATDGLDPALAEAQTDPPATVAPDLASAALLALLLERMTASEVATPAELEAAAETASSAFEAADDLFPSWDDVPGDAAALLAAAETVSPDATLSPAAFYAEAVALDELGLELSPEATALLELIRSGLEDAA